MGTTATGKAGAAGHDMAGAWRRADAAIAQRQGALVGGGTDGGGEQRGDCTKDHAERIAAALVSKSNELSRVGKTSRN
jgi:hypothetical protein